MRSSGDKAFGELLGQFRVEAKLTQQKLADLMRRTRGTIVNWENGTYLPKERAFILELAKHLYLDSLKRDQLLEAALFDPLGTIWTIPFQRNPFFTGREDILNYLHETLSTGKTVALMQPQALKGLGGIGKTHTTIEYAYRYRDEYQSILWTPATTSNMLQTSLVSIATALNLPQKNERDQDVIIKAVKHWLMNHSGWLLILDNVEDLKDVGMLYPWAHSGHVIITTRSQSVGGIALSISLEKMEPEEGALFLLRRADLISSHEKQENVQGTDFEKAKQLSEILGGLPLALDQAAAYIEQTRCGLSSYLKLYHSHRAKLLNERGSLTTDHPESVTITFSLAFQKVVTASAVAGELLQFCAFLSPDAIPEEIITNGGTYLGSTLELIATDAVEFNATIGILLAYSLVHRDIDIETRTQILSVHRLVQAVLQDSLQETERHAWVERAVRTVNAAFPNVEAGTWPQCERLLPQALAGAQSIEQYQMTIKEAGRLLYETASYLYDRARYMEAEPLYQRAISIREQQLGPEHPQVAHSLKGLANLYGQQGKYSEAEPLYRRALSIWEQQLGPEYSNVAHALNNLALLYSKQRKDLEAEPLYWRALSIWEQQLGPKHPLVAYPLNNLAGLYCEQGKYSEAEPLYWRALSIREQQLGPEHPQVAPLLNGLADLYRDQGKYSEAELLYQRALSIWEHRLGLEHPDVAYPLNNLALLYFKQGKYSEAEPLYRRALFIREQQSGSDPSETAESLHDLAVFQQARGNPQEALYLYHRALIMRQQVLGPKHPRTRDTQQRLTALQKEIGHEATNPPQEHSQSEQNI